MKPYRIVLQNLAVLALFVLAVLAYGWWRSDPSIVNRDLPVDFPMTPSAGTLGEPVVAQGVTVTVASLDRRRSTEGTGDLQLSSRARVDNLTDFVYLTIQVENGSEEPISLDYYGEGQRAELLLGVRRPTPTASLPLLPKDVEMLGAQPFPAGVLEPGESAWGALVFPVNRRARDLALAILPARFFTPDGHSLPSFEIDLDTGNLP